MRRWRVEPSRLKKREEKKPKSDKRNKEWNPKLITREKIQKKNKVKKLFDLGAPKEIQLFIRRAFTEKRERERGRDVLGFALLALLWKEARDKVGDE